MCNSVYCKSVVDGASVVYLLCQKSVYILDDERWEKNLACCCSLLVKADRSNVKKCMLQS